MKPPVDELPSQVAYGIIFTPPVMGGAWSSRLSLVGRAATLFLVLGLLGLTSDENKSP